MILKNNLLAKVREILRRDDTVLFIGSGLSMWSGLPSWSRLIEEMACFIENLGYSAEAIRKEALSGNMLQAASYGVDQLKPSEFTHFIRQTCRHGHASPSDLHKKIMKLGPTCFITTNYDHLIEDAFREVKNRELRTVTNRQLTETADIVQARATHFIFKPHGDLNDGDSIILTREHYRSILHGERKAALEALKTLLISRPVVFLGFGLRDPDFMFVQDYLLEVYKGGACDYYAIMPDISEQEQSFWLRKYGMHLLTYESKIEGEPDHNQLLTIIDNLQNISITVSDTSHTYKEVLIDLSANHILTLARYAKKIAYTLSVSSPIELPLQASLVSNDNTLETWDAHHHTDINNLLSHTAQNLVLIGNPGAGKTYTLKRHCSTLARNLENACLNETAQKTLQLIPIPLYVDLKLYNGDLWKQAEETLPPSLSLQELCASKQVRFILDSYNELPREYIENGYIEKDLAIFLQRTEGCRVFIASRTTEGLGKLAIPTFSLDQIDYDFVSSYLNQHGSPIQGVFKWDLLRLLTKPLFFRLYIENKITIQIDISPRAIYESLFRILANDFEQKYNIKIDLEEILCPIAYELLNGGLEATNLADLERHIKHSLLGNNIIACKENDFINWLISHDMLVSAPGLRLSFFHQSVTEYLAARKLARLYIMNPHILDKCLHYRRWDQALYLTLSFLNHGQSQHFMDQLTSMSLPLAITAAKYAEDQRDQIVTKILQEVLKKVKPYNTVDFILSALPVTSVHDSILRELLKRRNLLGAAAAELLLSIHKTEIKEELINEIFHYPQDYNFCTGIARYLRPYVNINDLRVIIRKFANLAIKTEEHMRGILAGFADMFNSLQPDDVIDAFCPFDQLNTSQMYLFVDFLWEYKTKKANQVKIELIKLGNPKAVFPLNLALIGNEENVNPDSFDTQVVTILIKHLSSYDEGYWAIDILKYICETRSDLASLVKETAKKESGLLKLILHYCSIKLDEADFWNEMNQLSLKGISKKDRKLLKCFGQIYLDWRGRTELLIRTLRLRDQDLATAILHTTLSLDQKGSPTENLNIPLEPLEWWIEFLSENPSSNLNIQGSTFHSSFGHFIVWHSTPAIHQKLIARFNQVDYPYRQALASFVLGSIPVLTTDALSVNALEFLIADLNRPRPPHSVDNLLGKISTEEFVQKELLILLKNKSEPFHTNLRHILFEAGRRHRRRYIPDDPNY